MTTEHIPVPALSATCPLCHTLDRTVTPESLLSGTYWTCARCGQKWTAARLETASAYQRDLAHRSASKGSRGLPAEAPC